MGAQMKTYATIRIIAVPPGEAPLWVRQQWVGLELPVVTAPRRFFGFGVLSSPRSMLAQWWGVARGRAQRIAGYAVEADVAVDILGRSSPDAAAWWRQNVPHLIGPRRHLVFHEHVCQVVQGT